MTWDDLGWITESWGGGEVIIKGIQTIEDAIIAADCPGVTAIYLSNYGGRQLDYSPSPLRTLLEIRRYRPDILRKVKIYIDGGIRRGTDVVKAVALGATAVGLGRPFIQALGSFGTDGVCRVVESEFLGKSVNDVCSDKLQCFERRSKLRCNCLVSHLCTS